MRVMRVALKIKTNNVRKIMGTKKKDNINNKNDPKVWPPNGKGENEFLILQTCCQHCTNPLKGFDHW